MTEKYYISEIIVENLWKQFTLKTKLFKDLNLFIGINGSGKTTLINLIKGILKVDFEILNNIDFQKAILKLSNKNNNNKTITIEKKEDFNFVFKISNKIYTLNLSRNRELWYRYDKNFKYRHAYSREIEEIRNIFKNLLSLHSISVYRQLDTENEDFDEDKFIEKPKNAIDKKIDSLEQKFIQYKGLINLNINKVSDDFRKDVFREILTIESDNTVIESIMKDFNIDETEIALKNLGLTDKNDKKLIEKFFNLQEAFAKKNSSQHLNNKKVQVDINDILFAPNACNLMKIIHLSNKMEDNKKELNKPIDDFIKVTNSFLTSSKFNKQIYVEDNKLKIKNKNEENVLLTNLSSGEKQLLILLLETLLQKHRNTIYIIDEPELSLHIAWQRALVNGILKLNPNIQLIIATHSPEIVSNYKDNIIRMERIVQ